MVGSRLESVTALSCGKLRKSSSESQAEGDQVLSNAVDGLKSVDVRVVGEFEGGAHSEGARRFSKLMLSKKAQCAVATRQCIAMEGPG